ncbi:TPA: leucine-rich repeat transmembrane neuronal protein 1 precursor, partial [Bos taurus]|jgi:hypothetical protein
LAG